MTPHPGSKNKCACVHVSSNSHHSQHCMDHLCEHHWSPVQDRLPGACRTQNVGRGSSLCLRQKQEIQLEGGEVDCGFGFRSAHLMVTRM